MGLRLGTLESNVKRQPPSSVADVYSMHRDRFVDFVKEKTQTTWDMAREMIDSGKLGKVVTAARMR